jgi:hypothetical protein
MLKAVYNSTETPGQFSLRNEWLGFGACMAAAARLNTYKRICREARYCVRRNSLVNTKVSSALGT